MSTILEFHFYLDAWMWCRQNGLKFKHEYMTRKDFKTWVLALPQRV